MIVSDGEPHEGEDYVIIVTLRLTVSGLMTLVKLVSLCVVLLKVANPIDAIK